MDKLLPVGSVVRLKGGKRKLVIMGILQFDSEKKDKLYDYLGVPYPEGYMGQGSGFLFYHKDIEQFFFRGYEDEEREKMLAVVETMRQAAGQSLDAAGE